MVIGTFLEGESKMLADTVVVNNRQNLEVRRSGLELWRVLKYNFDRTSVLNAISILESIRNVHASKNIQDVMLQVNALERRHWEYYRQAVGSKEFVKMKTHGISIYPEVFKKAVLLKVLLETIVKELKKSTNVDFEKDSHSEIRDEVTTIVHNHMNAAMPMDVNTHITSIEMEKEKEGEDKSVEHHDNSTAAMTRKPDPCATWEGAQTEDGRPKACRR